jgi:hypothetical protein
MERSVEVQNAPATVFQRERQYTVRKQRWDREEVQKTYSPAVFTRNLFSEILIPRICNNFFDIQKVNTLPVPADTYSRTKYEPSTLTNLR